MTMNIKFLTGMAEVLGVDLGEVDNMQFAHNMVGMLMDVKGMEYKDAYEVVFGEGSFDKFVREVDSLLVTPEPIELEVEEQALNKNGEVLLFVRKRPGGKRLKYTHEVVMNLSNGKEHVAFQTTSYELACGFMSARNKELAGKPTQF